MLVRLAGLTKSSRQTVVHLAEAHSGVLPAAGAQVAVGWRDNDARCLDAP
jgi:hypothetical protein